MKRECFQIGDVTLSVVKSGQGAPFVFQHGLCGSADQTNAVFPKDLNWQLVTMECRGHGRSDFGDPSLLSIDQFADDVAKMITDLGVGPVIMGGISMGAAIALRLAITQPELVKSLILARPAWINQAAPENLAPNSAVAQFLSDHEPARAKLLFGESQTATRLRRESPDNLASLLGFFDRAPQAQTQALLSAIAKDGPGVEVHDIAQLKIPTLVIGTAHDVIHPLSMARELAAMIPPARFIEVTAKSSNAAQYQAEFQSALRRFLMEFE